MTRYFLCSKKLYSKWKRISIDKMEFHLEELVKKFIKDKKTKVAVAVNNKIIVKSEWRKKEFLMEISLR